MDRIEIIHRITEPTRYKIIGLLLKRHYCVRALAKSLGVSEPAVSQHIRALKETGIVTGERIGYQTHYIVKKESLAALFAEAAEEISECPPPPAIRKACYCEYGEDCARRVSEEGVGHERAE